MTKLSMFCRLFIPNSYIGNCGSSHCRIFFYFLCEPNSHRESRRKRNDLRYNSYNGFFRRVLNYRACLRLWTFHLQIKLFNAFIFLMASLFCFGANCTEIEEGQSSKETAGKGKSREGQVKFGFSLVKGKANHPMEDYHVAKFMRINGHELGLFAVYDGHLGHAVPSYLERNLFNNILKEDGFWANPSDSISNAYEKTDEEILKCPILGRGGSTAVTAILINGQRLWVANVGDSRAVLSKGDEVIQLTVEHEPNAERRSIVSKGGFVSNIPGDVSRVNGQLAVSRAFGNRSLKPHVRSDPDIRDVTIDVNCDLLILASDGLWKVMSNEEAVRIVKTMNDPKKAAALLTSEALKRKSRDDICCIVVKLRN